MLIVVVFLLTDMCRYPTRLEVSAVAHRQDMEDRVKQRLKNNAQLRKGESDDSYSDEDEQPKQEQKEEEEQEQEPQVPEAARFQGPLRGAKERRDERLNAAAPVPLQARLQAPAAALAPPPMGATRVAASLGTELDVTRPFQLRIGNRHINMVSKAPLLAQALIGRSSAVMSLTAHAPSMEDMIALLQQERIPCEEDDTLEQLASLALETRVTRVNIGMPTATTEMEDHLRLRRVDTPAIHAAIIPIKPAERRV